MRDRGLKQRKALGQVFLKVDWPLVRIADLLASRHVERVLEIGPGGGVLTRQLLSRGWQVTAIEKDRRFAERLQAESQSDQLEVVCADVLGFDFASWVAASPGPCAVCGNIPYNISSPILLSLLPLLPELTGVVLMTQYEFARRVAAEPGGKDYGSLSVYTQLRSQTSLAFDVPREAFKPVPKVDSAVIEITHRESSLSPELLAVVETVCRSAFQKRRKTLRNSLADLIARNESDLGSSPIDLSRRPETLSPAEFVALASWLDPAPEPK